MIKFYRAVCKDEFKSNLEYNKRFKWASLDKDWIISRVMSQNFNNSKYKEDRYSILVSFEIREKYIDKVKRLNNKEWMFGRRKNVKFYNIQKEGLK